MNRPYDKPSPSDRSSRPVKKAKKLSGWMEVLLFYILPFLVFNGILLVLVAARPHIAIQVADTRDYRTTTATITVRSILPIQELTFAQEGVPFELTEGKKGIYTAELTQNGVIEIHARSINGMTDTKYEHVNILDDVAPMVGEQYSIQDGILTIQLEDSQSGLDYPSVCADTASGVHLLPTSIDKSSSTFTFEMGEETLMIHASDLAGNAMQATFSTHIETLGSEDALPPENGQTENQETAEESGSAAIYIHTDTP